MLLTYTELRLFRNLFAFFFLSPSVRQKKKEEKGFYCFLLLNGMFLFSLRRLCSVSSLTDSVAAHSPSSRGIHKSKRAAQEQLKHRLRQRRLQRGRNIAAKEAEVQRSMENVSSSRDILVGQLADEIFARGHRHVASATNVNFVPDGNPATPLVALAGRETCGKTSLLRSLFRSAGEVGRSNRQLRRDAMNFFNVGDVFNVADLPGCGGTSVPWSTVLQHAVLLRNFARCQPSLKMLYYCMDVHYKHGVYVQDIDLLRFLCREVPNFTIVITKADQINDHAARLVHMEDIRKELLYNDIHHPVLVTSAFHMGGVDTLRYDMVMNCLHAVPTERLTLTEARRLSARLFSQKELSTIRPLTIAPSLVEDERQAWLEDIQCNEQTEAVKQPTHARIAAQVSTEAAGGLNSINPQASDGVDGDDADLQPRQPAEAEGAERGEDVATSRDAAMALPEAAKSLDAASASASPIPVVFDDPVTQVAYERVVKMLRNKPLFRYVDATSPWRNPLRWPRHVVPTKHPKVNIMRCPEAPENPYLFQPQFVAPRADLYFRRPNVGVRKSSQKGRYEADRALAFLVKSYTIPYFPDIVDTAMQPTPWAFLGSREAYYERNGGRQLGVRLLNYAMDGALNPLSDSPAPAQPELAKEVEKLEAKRYGAPIAMLRPPELDQDTHAPSLPHRS